MEAFKFSEGIQAKYPLMNWADNKIRGWKTIPFSLVAASTQQGANFIISIIASVILSKNQMMSLVTFSVFRIVNILLTNFK